jgi:hypothetical protein
VSEAGIAKPTGPDPVPPSVRDSSNATPDDDHCRAADDDKTLTDTREMGDGKACPVG